MYRLNIWHITGMAVALLGIMFVGKISGKGIKDANDFSNSGGKSSALMISGTLMGTLVGGSSTVATAQLAFNYGYSAVWFNLGAGISCLILAFLFAKKLRNTKVETLQEIVENEYGKVSGISSSILSCVGTFLSIVAQLLSAIALLESVLSIPTVWCSIISCFVMILYVNLGGIKGTGNLGILKTALLYFFIIFSGIFVIISLGGYNEFKQLLPNKQYFNLFARGIGIDGGAAFSVILGVICTQTYAQTILSAKNNKEAVKGALLSALLIPPIGYGSTLIGMYMKANFPNMNPALCFPNFILLNLPNFVAGMVLSILFIVTIGSGAGLALGIGSVINKNIFLRWNPNANKITQLKIIKNTIVVTLVLALLLTFGNLKTLILQWTFMSMGLRAAVIFFPLCTALFLPKKIPVIFLNISIIFSPIIILIARVFFNFKFDELFIGMLFSFSIIFLGFLKNIRHGSTIKDH